MADRKKFIVVTGVPASGKTTLATKLAEEFDSTYIDKDDINVLGMRVLGAPEDQRSGEKYSSLVRPVSYPILAHLGQLVLQDRVEEDLVTENLTQSMLLNKKRKLTNRESGFIDDLSEEIVSFYKNKGDGKSIVIDSPYPELSDYAFDSSAAESTYRQLVGSSAVAGANLYILRTVASKDTIINRLRTRNAGIPFPRDEAKLKSQESLGRHFKKEPIYPANYPKENPIYESFNFIGTNLETINAFNQAIDLFQ